MLEVREGSVMFRIGKEECTETFGKRRTVYWKQREALEVETKVKKCWK